MDVSERNRIKINPAKQGLAVFRSARAVLVTEFGMAQDAAEAYAKDVADDVVRLLREGRHTKAEASWAPGAIIARVSGRGEAL